MLMALSALSVNTPPAEVIAGLDLDVLGVDVEDLVRGIHDDADGLIVGHKPIRSVCGVVKRDDDRSETPRALFSPSSLA